MKVSKVQQIRSRVVKVFRDHGIEPRFIDSVVNGYRYKIREIPSNELEIILEAIKALDSKYVVTSKTSTYAHRPFRFDAIAITVKRLD